MTCTTCQAHKLGDIVEIDNKSKLFEGFGETNICLMSHGDFVSKLPVGFKIIGKTPNCPIAAIENEEKGFYGIQFHPFCLEHHNYP